MTHTWLFLAGVFVVVSLGYVPGAAWTAIEKARALGPRAGVVSFLDEAFGYLVTVATLVGVQIMGFALVTVFPWMPDLTHWMPFAP